MSRGCRGSKDGNRGQVLLGVQLQATAKRYGKQGVESRCRRVAVAEGGGWKRGRISEVLEGGRLREKGREREKKEEKGGGGDLEHPGEY